MCAEAGKRINTHLAAWFIIRTRMGCLEKFRKLVTLYREDLWLQPNSAERPKEGEAGHHIQVLMDKFAGAQRLSHLVGKVIVDSVCEGGSDSVAIGRECHGLDGGF